MSTSTPQSTKPRHRFRRPLETLGTRLGFWLVPRLPRALINGISRVAGPLVYGFDARSRRIGLTNLDLFFGEDKTPAQKKQILKASAVHFARSMLDVFWFSRDTELRCRKYVHFDPSCDQLLNNDPALCLTGHLGNWEVMGIAYAQRGYLLMSVAAPLKNAEVDQLFIAAREKTGQLIIPQQGAIRKLYKGLREGGKMTVLLDQNTREKDGGVFINFCGKQVLVSPAPAAMALKTKAPIHIVYCLPDAKGHYTAYAPVEVSYCEEDSAERLTQRMSDAFTETIREHPECWLWTYKRFKYIPPGADAADYPWYSKPAR